MMGVTGRPDPPRDLTHQTKSKRWLITPQDDTAPETLLAAPAPTRVRGEEAVLNTLVTDCKAVSTFLLTRDVHMKVRV